MTQQKDWLQLKCRRHCEHKAHLCVFRGIYCYDCGKFLGKDPEDVKYPETQEILEAQETWHDRPPLL